MFLYRFQQRWWLHSFKLKHQTWEPHCNSNVPRFTARDRLNTRMVAYDVHLRVTEDLQLRSDVGRTLGWSWAVKLKNKLQNRFRLVFVLLDNWLPKFLENHENLLKPLLWTIPLVNCFTLTCWLWKFSAGNRWRDSNGIGRVCGA